MAAIGRVFDVYRCDIFHFFPAGLVKLKSFSDEGNNGDREYLGKSNWPPEITQDPSGGDFLQMKVNNIHGACLLQTVKRHGRSISTITSCVSLFIRLSFLSVRSWIPIWLYCTADICYPSTGMK
jgi:hypothetical protein